MNDPMKSLNMCFPFSVWTYLQLKQEVWVGYIEGVVSLFLLN